MNLLLYLVVLPVAAGILCLLIPRRARGITEGITLVVSLITFGITILLFSRKPLQWAWADSPVLRLDNLSGFILLAVGLFGFLIALYSIRFMRGKPRLKEYYAYFLWTLGATCGAILANNLILLLVFWGFLGLTLYLLIGIEPEATAAAKKTFIIVGGADCLMILGIGIILLLTNSLAMDQISIPLEGRLPVLAYLCLAIAAFAKAGAMPFHSWIPDTAEKAPVSVTAFLPASLDKLLGIYLLGRISMHLFQMNKALGLLLMIIGAFTIVAAVMMALVQHDLKKLLGYHAVSQVGYMVLGIGTGNPVGIAGGLFHMLNNAIYKQCLFLVGGSVEHRTGTADLDRLGGLARAMPITFICCLITALSISGVPPFNGFVSKWMVYQGLIELGKTGDKLWVIWLTAAMFGSALTLASFMKLTHATFLGQSSSERAGSSLREVSPSMWFPMVVLAGLCVLFGVFALPIPLKGLILPAVPGVSFLGFWSSSLATLLIIIGIVIGAVIYWIGKIKSFREVESSYVGGEAVDSEMRVSGVDFYNTIRDMGLFEGVYKRAEEKLFDIYDLGRKVTFFFTKGLRRAHAGVLTAYFSWALAGLIILLWVMLVR